VPPLVVPHAVAAMKSACLLVVLACLAPIAAAQPPPVAAFAAPPAMLSPAISPDGLRYAFIRKTEDAGHLVYAVQLANNQADAIVESTTLDGRAVAWANNDTLVLLVSETVTTYFGAKTVESFAPVGIDLAGTLKVQLLDRGGTRVIGGGTATLERRLIGYERATGRVLLLGWNRDGRRVVNAVNAKNDTRTEIEDGSSFTRDWVVDENGVPRYRIDFTDKYDVFEIFRRGDDQWDRFVERTIEVPELDLPGLDAQGELIVGVRPANVGRYGLYVVSSDGTLGRTLHAHDTLDVTNVRVDPYTNRVVGAEVEGESPVWFDENLAMQQAALEESFPDEFPWIENWSQDRSRFVVRAERTDHAPKFFVYDVQRRTVSAIGSAYPALDGVELAPRLPYTYTARDGVEIPGYLTRPLGVDGPAPLVLVPHSGPADRDVDGFDWFAHFLASRGYVVLQPNFRGSYGYGRDWEEAGHGGWGVGVMQHDLTDGVAAVVAAGIADPERVCIVGASYGGYAALAGAAFTPELYRCAAAIAGVADLRDMLDLYRARRGDRNAAVEYWRRSLGVEDTLSTRDLDVASPAQYAERVQAAVLLIHGRDDPVVPIGQSRTMERALRRAGKTVQLVELEGEDHWLSDAATRLAALQALETFLAQHLGSR
jgi:dipeptidyl aminopeptidase/acylaminoacyl peptidase